jgi:hypothetical protein
VQPLNPPKHKILIEIPPYYIDTLIKLTQTRDLKCTFFGRRFKYQSQAGLAGVENCTDWAWMQVMQPSTRTHICCFSDEPWNNAWIRSQVARTVISTDQFTPNVQSGAATYSIGCVNKTKYLPNIGQIVYAKPLKYLTLLYRHLAWMCVSKKIWMFSAHLNIFNPR